MRSSPPLGLEVFHNFTLLHDDLMDELIKKEQTYRTQGMECQYGDSFRRCDANSGLSINRINGTRPPQTSVGFIYANRSGNMARQQFDMEFESRMDVSEEEYIEMIRLKTAVLLACALKTGALLGGASQKDADHLYAFGINIGLAFQLQDDLLDVIW